MQRQQSNNNNNSNNMSMMQGNMAPMGAMGGGMGPMGGNMGPMGGGMMNQREMMQREMMQREMLQRNEMMQREMLMREQMMGQMGGYNQSMGGNYGSGSGYSNMTPSGIEGVIHGMVGEMFLQPIRVEDAILTPPPPGAPPRTTRERPPGCRTIFIGGLPENTTENILRGVFGTVGKPINVRLSKKNFAHIRFEYEQSADQAVKFSGWTMKIGEEGDENTRTNCQRIHVDYAIARDDQSEHDSRQKEYYRVLRNQMLGEEDSDNMILYSEKESNMLHEKLRDNETFTQATQVLTAWYERGDCTRRNAGGFYSMTQTAHSHVRRMASEKEQYVLEYQMVKERFNLQLQTILTQFEQVEKVFEAAMKQKVWDHFTKAQRKNITSWHQAVQEAKKENVEFVLSQRQEDAMDLSDQEMEDGSDQPVAKRSRSDGHTSHRDGNEQLKSQMEAFRNDAISTRLEMDASLNQKDTVISFLRTALSNTQRQLLESKTRLTKLEGEMKKLHIQNGTTGDDESTEKTEGAADEAQAEADTDPVTETSPGDDAKANTESDEAKAKTESDEAKAKTESDEAKAKTESDEAKAKTESGDTKAVSGTATDTKSIPMDDKEEGDSDSTEVDAEEAAKKAEEKEKDDLNEDAVQAEIDRLMSADPNAEPEQKKSSKNKKKPEKEMSEMDRLIAEAMEYASEKTPKPQENEKDKGVTEKELKVIGIVCTFLNVHPYGATVDYLSTYLDHLNIRMSNKQLDRLLTRTPCLFYHGTRGLGSSVQKLWCFVGYTGN